MKVCKHPKDGRWDWTRAYFSERDEVTFRTAQWSGFAAESYRGVVTRVVRGRSGRIDYELVFAERAMRAGKHVHGVIAHLEDLLPDAVWTRRGTILRTKPCRRKARSRAKS